MARYDWYDPNRKISGLQIGGAATNFTSADIKYTTIGIGLTHYFNSNLKLLGYYDIVSNENTNLTGYKSNIPDNVFTLRMQLRF
jgi:predicted porin